MEKYLTKIENATSEEQLNEIINISEEDENITNEEWLEICNEAEQKIFEINNKEEYTEYDEFDDKWHSGEFE